MEHMYASKYWGKKLYFLTVCTLTLKIIGCQFDKESMVGFVIQATVTVEFEDGLRMEVLPGG